MGLTLPFKEQRDLYHDNFSLHFLGNDINNKFALISLVAYLVYKLRPKNPDVTEWSVLCKINGAGPTSIPDDILKRRAIICEDFGDGCTSFPTFGIAEKDIPAKIKELLEKYVPF